jgi:hypothetical protein
MKTIMFIQIENKEQSSPNVTSRQRVGEGGVVITLANELNMSQRHKAGRVQGTFMFVGVYFLSPFASCRHIHLPSAKANTGSN